MARASRSPPATGGGGAQSKQESVTAPITSPTYPISRLEISGKGTGGDIPVDAVTPQPIKTLNLPFERALMLATMPRKKWDELTWAAFTGAAAALPSAVDAFIHAYKRNPFALEAFETVQVLIFFGFVVWFISLFFSRHEQTSLEYLRELYSLPPPSTTKKWWKIWQY
jgi:hypothetical protein